MKVSEIMRTSVRTIPAEATVAEAVQAMADAHVSGLPVVNHAGGVIGVISTTDVLQAQAEHDDRRARTNLFENTTVRELMTNIPLTVAPSEEVRAAARLMLERGVHRLFVVEDERLVGVLSQTDITHAFGTGKL